MRCWLCPSLIKRFRYDNNNNNNSKPLYPNTRSVLSANMGAQKKTRKFAQVKRIIGQRDARLKKNQDTGKPADSKKKTDDVIREV